MERDFLAQEGILSQTLIRRHPVELIGAGGIGSWLTILLVNEGYGPISVWDPDTVEAVNAQQAYQCSQLGRPKAEALAETIRQWYGRELAVHVQRFTADNEPEGLVIAAVDTMAARREIWQAVLHNRLRVPLFIDTRMGGEMGIIFTINPANALHVDYYEERMYSDEQAADIRCNERSIVHNLWTIGAYVGSQLKCFLAGEEFAVEIHFDLKTRTLVFRDHRGRVQARLVNSV